MGKLEDLGYSGNSAETALISCDSKTEEVCVCVDVHVHASIALPMLVLHIHHFTVELCYH